MRNNLSSITAIFSNPARVSFIAIFFCVLHNVYGQKNLRLEDCYEIALKNRSEIRNAEIDKQNAKLEWEKEKSGLLPSVNMSYSHSFNYDANSTSFLGTYSGTVSASGSMKLFDWFSTWRQIELAENKFIQQDESFQQQKLEILSAVTESFFTLLFRKEQLTAGEQQLILTDSIVENTKILFSHGKIIQNDVEESMLQQMQEKRNIITLQKEFDLAKTELLDLLRQNNNNTFFDFEYYENQAKIDSFYLMDYNQFESIVIENYPYLKTLELEKDIYILTYKLINSQNKPELGLNYSASTGYSEIGMSFPEINFYNNIENSFAGVISLNLTIPIFNHKEAKTNSLISAANIKKSENTYNAELFNFKTILKKQYIGAQASIEQFNMAKSELAIIKEILKKNIQLYNSGKDNIFTTLTYKQKYNDILNNYILSKYEAMLKVETLKLYYQKL